MVAMRPPFNHNHDPNHGAADGPRGPPRHRMVSARPPKRHVNTDVIPIHKPVASSSGITCSILMAEPNVFLAGLDHDGRARRGNRPTGTALLRGKLQLVLTKNIKIKTVQLKLAGKTRTEWPEGIPPMRLQEWEEDSLRTQVLTFFDAINDGWETEYGNQCSFSLKDGAADPASTHVSIRSGQLALDSPPFSRRGGLTSKELKKLKLRSVRSRSFGQGDVPVAKPAVLNPKGYKIFRPGTYEYSFELPIDHHQLETTKLPFGSVKWELQASVERHGAFRANLNGTKEVSIVRVPDQLSLETTEPISISRQWDDQLHYDIVVSGKSFAIGSKIPIAFKFTPLAKVQVYKIRVYIAESIEYWTNNRLVTRREPGRKILLLEKTAGKPMDPSLGAELRTTSGGELSPGERRSAREVAATRNSTQSAGRDSPSAPLPEPSNNLLGDLDLGLENFWGPTEIEANVQIPTCEMMKKDNNLILHPDSSWKNVSVDHWIRIVMRVSRADPDDPTGTKRRHFEISIDSPITLLNCRATQTNTNLPEYSGFDHASSYVQRACGCADSASLSLSEEHVPNSPRTIIPDGRMRNPNGRPRPYSAIEPMGNTRPIHLIRMPSFGPPEFDADEPPPPADEHSNNIDTSSIMTPPPRYDTIIGTPSVDGLADYFARLAAHGFSGPGHDMAIREDEESPEEDDDSDSDGTTLAIVGPQRLTERTGRVNVVNPRTPGGGRVPSRSLEIARPAVDFILAEPPQRKANVDRGTAAPIAE
ncbi:hypothetical protein jhhlp_000107 [Lomentospora prolificans]|uniref:Arrestin C-terminal-like domain-containing protein n=1 Tax=Lomentospora prolificans TaxID=41688 RepID=A0A2N3NLK0_9PEZI|nr:hypothetical protein jhhlp_000107 [Lomentospora prolificans]